MTSPTRLAFARHLPAAAQHSQGLAPAKEEGKNCCHHSPLLRAMRCLEDLKSKLRGDEKFAVDLLARALQEPCRAIAENAGADGAVVVDDILSKDSPTWGFDARRLEYCDMVKAGIVDPTKVTKSALLHAVSVAGTMLTTRVMVTELKDKDRKKAIAGSVA